MSVLADAVLDGVTSAEPVNLAFGTTINELAKRVIAAVGVSTGILHAPPRGRCMGFTAASSRLRELFSNAVPTDLDEGLKRTVAWPELAQLVHSGIVVDAAEGLVDVLGQRVSGGDDVVSGLALDGEVAAGGADEFRDWPAAPVLDPPADG